MANANSLTLTNKQTNGSRQEKSFLFQPKFLNRWQKQKRKKKRKPKNQRQHEFDRNYGIISDEFMMYTKRRRKRIRFSRLPLRSSVHKIQRSSETGVLPGKRPRGLIGIGNSVFSLSNLESFPWYSTPLGCLAGYGAQPSIANKWACHYHFFDSRNGYSSVVLVKLPILVIILAK